MELKWWINNLTLIKGSPVHLQNPEMIIYSDASSHQGWGAAMEGDPSTGGSWSLKEKNRYHINELELITAEIAIKTFTKERKVSSIYVYIDNMTALAYLIKMGGQKARPI